MNVLDAVETVLKQADTPLHNGELTKRVLASGLWHTDGKTPNATINAQLAVDIKKRGDASRFKRAGAGTFGLRDGLASAPPAPIVNLSAKDVKFSDPPPKAAGSTSVHVSFTDATEQVLSKFGDKKPMHYRDVAKKALELGLVKTSGKTPEATLYAQVITEIQRRKKRGELGRFVMHGKGFIGLTRWRATGLAFEIDQHNAQVRKKLRERLGKMPFGEFEDLIGALLIKLGFEDVVVTGKAGDGGIDVRGVMVTGDVMRTRMAIQAKRWKQNVQAPIVQQVRGSLGTHDQGLIITTSDYSKGARDEAGLPNKIPVALMNGEQLVALLVENDIGVKKTTHSLIELVTESVNVLAEAGDEAE